MAYPCEFFWLLVLFIKEASVTIFNLFPPPNLNPNVRIFNKQLITLFTVCTYVGFGFVRKCNNFNVANVMFGQVIMAM